MPWFNIFKCFPKKQKEPQKDENGNGPENVFADKDGFTKKQKSKAVAIVLSGYDAEIAAASIGSPPCDAEMVQNWVTLYRPTFFEEGMRCPPALILWWMKEIERRDTEFSDALYGNENSPNETSSLASVFGSPLPTLPPTPPQTESKQKITTITITEETKLQIQDPTAKTAIA